MNELSKTNTPFISQNIYEIEIPIIQRIEKNKCNNESIK